MKKALSILLCLALLFSIFTGCTSEPKEAASNSGESAETTSESSASAENSNLTAPGEYPIVKEKVTIKIASVDQPYQGKIAESDFMKWFEEKTNVHIEFNEIQKTALSEKVNLLLVSGDLPDAFLAAGITKSMEVQYGFRGAFLALNDLIETQGVEIKQIMKDIPSAEQAITAPDGNIYSLPLINDCFHCKYGTRSWINQDWLTAVGMNVPNTTAEFETVLQAFKDQDPNGNGKQDEFPLMGSPNWSDNIIPILVQPFIFSDNLYLQDGKTVTLNADKPEYKEALLWIRSLIQKGLIDPTSLTQTAEQYTAVLTDPSAITVGVPVSFNPHSRFLGDISRVKQYVGLPPLEGPNGVRGMTTNAKTQSVSSGVFVITNKCETPEVAFRWADAWYAEDATMNSWYGLEGIGRKTAESGVGLNGEPALWEPSVTNSADYSDPEQLTTVTNMFGNNSKRLREGQLFDETVGNGKYELEAFLHFQTQEVFSKYGLPDLQVPPLYWLETEATEYSSLNTQVADYIKEQTTLFLLGEKDIEKDWDSYVAEFSKLGVDQLLSMVQTAYDRQYT